MLPLLNTFWFTTLHHKSFSRRFKIKYQKCQKIIHINWHLLIYYYIIFHIFYSRRNTELTAESIKHLEKVFRENLAKDKDEFTLSEFKRIVPSKNVSWLLNGPNEKRWHMLDKLNWVMIVICILGRFDNFFDR